MYQCQFRFCVRYGGDDGVGGGVVWWYLVRGTFLGERVWYVVWGASHPRVIGLRVPPTPEAEGAYQNSLAATPDVPATLYGWHGLTLSRGVGGGGVGWWGGGWGVRFLFCSVVGCFFFCFPPHHPPPPPAPPPPPPPIPPPPPPHALPLLPAVLPPHLKKLFCAPMENMASRRGRYHCSPRTGRLVLRDGTLEGKKKQKKTKKKK